MEVMVALAIMSVSVVAVFQLYSLGLRSVQKADDYTHALLHAQAMLDEAYALPDPSDASDTREEEKRYKMARDVVVVSESEDRKTKLYRITVTAAWPPAGKLSLTGLRSVYAPQE